VLTKKRPSKPTGRQTYPKTARLLREKGKTLADLVGDLKFEGRIISAAPIPPGMRPPYHGLRREVHEAAKLRRILYALPIEYAAPLARICD
jgi:hypothetical protein